jgi:pimeloyl-ACP methyl ester carboxylesterase|tara:strand:+ start:13545 stop:15215 length:1671 start_codon:yes stop_codon:yes gene_type:complete
LTKRFIIVFPVLFFLYACSGGGGGGGTPAPTPAPAEPVPLPIDVLDSVPDATTSLAAHQMTGFSVIHATQADATFELDLDCGDLETLTVRRSLVDLADEDVDQLVDHKFSCNELAANTSYSVTVDESRSNGDLLQGVISFQSDDSTMSVSVLADQFVQKSDVNDLFTDYINAVLVDEFDLDLITELLLLPVIIDLLTTEWDNLADPNTRYDVISQRVQYASIQPDGSYSMSLTGLVAFPDVGDLDAFEKRGEVILLNHATGSTPSEMDSDNAWFILAELLAGQGYLVVAADNFGRGGTEDSPETYLQGNRTGINSVDLLRAVTESGDYDSVFETEAPVDVDIIGYSQGGHSAIASWLELVRHHGQRFQTRVVHSGGAPYDVYRTFRGVMQQIAGTCNDDGYCRLVESDVLVPFATDRILPGLLAYVDVGLSEADLIAGEELDSDFVTGFIEQDADYDDLKSSLQLNSYTNVVNAEEVFQDALVDINLYHSEYDRLVPVDNSLDFFDAIDGNVQSTLHDDHCNGTGFQLIFESIDKVGVIHTLCALNVLNEVFDQLR